YGMFIQSSVGRCLINMTEVDHNWGDGIKFYLSNLTIFDFRMKFPPAKSFCASANSPEMTFPFYQHMDLVQVNGNDRTSEAIGGNCDRVFTTAANMKITLHFMIVERDPDPAVTGKFIIRDGLLGTSRTIIINNGTFPQSITTKSNTLNIQFQYTVPHNLICKTFPPCIRFLLEFTSGFDVEEEFRLLMSNVHDNIGYGVNIQDMRSKVRISNETVISNNQFGAGVLVYKGAGDIVINGTRLENNSDAGVNITYSGGYQLINGTQFIRNKGYGIITEYMKLNHTRIESQNKIEFVRTKFMWNEMIGLRMGNYCRGGDILINESYFAYNYDEAIEYLSCNISTPYKTKFRLEFNIFNDNFRHALLMRPLLNTDGIITNNTFANHSLSTLKIDNGYDLLISRYYRDFPVTFKIFENVFENNMGRYVVNIRLTQYSATQNLYCKFNHFLRNEINDSFPFLNPRSRANAVIVLSSSNIQFRRNNINNPGSLREVATHLVDPSVAIDATENYWGTEINRQADYENVYKSIFDQDDRYNLALITYHPALKTIRLYENYLSDDVPAYVWQFYRGNVIGGILENTFVCGQGKTLYVDRDIYVFPDKTLLMEAGCKLKFLPSVGMVVHGVLRADGVRRETPLIFDIDDREEFIPVENRTATVRLMNGTDEFEGRLEVEINGVWGTVCRDGWIVENSLLACQQLGLVYNPEYPTARLQTPAPTGTPILMSWVSCDDVDVDLTQCRSVNIDAATCDHSKDVYLRCQLPTWSGITLAAAYKTDQVQPVQSESQIRFAELNNAGLLDPDTGELTPALRIDYNYYQISWLTVRNSMSDGILISYNHPYTLNKMEYITVLNSARNGIVTRSPKLEVMHSRLDGNQMAGFLYDPFFTEYDALLIRNTIYPQRRIDMFGKPLITLQPDQLMFLICPAGQSKVVKDYFVEIQSSSVVYKVVVQILDYLPIESAEKVIIYDSDLSHINASNTKRWQIEKDLVDFPILSSFSVVTIHLKVNGQLSGRLAFAVIRDTDKPDLRTAVTNTTFNYNKNGVVTKHYNNPSNKRLELFFRHKEETIFTQYTMHMPSVTKFTDDYIPTYEDMTRPERVAVINYTVFQCEFRDNAMGILAEHNHVDFANNVWKWRLDHVTVQGTKTGGLEIEVPRVNDFTEKETHAVTVVVTIFQNNNNFAFTIAGYYTVIKVENNAFLNNVCRLGLISITGMEKNMTVNGNRIQDNICRYMVDINVISHSEYFSSVMGQMDLNDISNNRYEGEMPPGSDNSPKTYAVAVRGLQNLEVNFNLFRNPQLDYELVAGITSILLGSSMNATRNFWGFTDQPNIRRRIFDFDDWNNYAIAEYFPYLSVADPNSVPTTGIREEFYLDPNQLGGRVEKSQVLAEIGRPYIVTSDLTVMPGVTLTITGGTELQFMPDVGILVLGRLVANGLPNSRIKFQPLLPSNNPKFSLRRRDVSLDREKRESVNTTVRLLGDGTLFKDAGFLEMYNSSTKNWNMMCDSQFHEKTAEVVCRQLGKEVINVKVRFTHLYDYYIYGKPMYSRKEFWYYSYYCRGDETSLSQCITRYNYNLLDCVYAANYTFITCGDRNLDSNLQYWGNIRFAMDSYEEQPLEKDIGIDRSSLTYVDIHGAGMLHGEKVGAVQSTYVTPIFNNINISNCAENGYDIIAPRQNLDVQLQNISGNLGFGVNILVLNGESSIHRSSFQPSGPNTMPYSVHGLVDMCRLEKEIQVETRLILFYKYGPYTRDCVKIIRSKRTVGLRFLQVNLFQEDFSRNSIEIYDGETATAPHIGRIVANSSTDDMQQLYQTTGSVMAVHIHASVSFGSFGFIAEVVKLPLSGLTYPNSDYRHNIQQCEIRYNQDGALQYKTVGETTPSLYIEHCWMGDNGYPILNLTSPPSIDISLQSIINFRFSHNQVSYNKGGMYLYAYTSSLNTALKGNFTNNVFAFGKNGEALNISGHYFQHLMFFQNYVYNYTAGDYRDVIHIKDVLVNLTHNYIVRNLGHYIIHTYDSDDSTDTQIFARNGIYNNNATALREATIKIGQGMPKFVNNFFVNPLNDFEIATYPKPSPNTQPIDAKSNWWGSEREAYISGKTYDSSDDSSLVEVEFWPPVLDNRTLVEGNCLPGWVFDQKRCYRYMGGALPFEQAKQFCQSHGAFLAESRDREDFFNYLIRLMVIQPDWTQRVWVMADVGLGRCSAFELSYVVYEEECTRRYYPFICETDPQVSAPTELESAVQAMIIGITVGVGGIIIIIIAIIVILWCIKSKRREKERFERTASIRSSISNMAKLNGSLRGTKSTVTILSGGAARQRLDDLEERSVVSSCGKNSQNSIVSNGTSRSEQNISSRFRRNQNQDSTDAVAIAAKGRPHNLRPEKIGTDGRNLTATRNVESGMLNVKDRQREDENRRGAYGGDNVGEGNKLGSYRRDNVGEGNRVGTLGRDNVGEENKTGTYGRDNVGEGNRVGSLRRDNVGEENKISTYRRYNVGEIDRMGSNTRDIGEVNNRVGTLRRVSNIGEENRIGTYRRDNVIEGNRMGTYRRDDGEENKRGVANRNAVENSTKNEPDANVNNCDEDSDDKDSFISDSTFDDVDEEENDGYLQAPALDIDAINMQYNIDRSNEQLFQRPMAPSKTGIDSLIDVSQNDENDFTENPYRNRPVPSLRNPVKTPSNNAVFPQRTIQREDLPTPPPDPRNFQFRPEPNKHTGKPLLAPKPRLLGRTKASGSREHLSSARSESTDSQYTATFMLPSPQNEDIDNHDVYDEDSNDHIYSNQLELQINHPVNDTRPKGSISNLYLTEPQPLSQRSEHDPDLHSRSQANRNARSPHEASRSSVYSFLNDNHSPQNTQGDTSYHSQPYTAHPTDLSHSTDRYENIDYSLARDNLYGVDQQPDLDYLPRDLHNQSAGYRMTSPSHSSLSDPTNYHDSQLPQDLHNQSNGYRMTSPSHSPLSDPTNYHDSQLPRDLYNQSEGYRMTSPSHSSLSNPISSHGSQPTDSSLLPSVEANVDYMPRRDNSVVSNRFLNSVSQYQREEMSPHESVSSYDSNNSRPPPYSLGHTFQSAQSPNRDRLNQTGESRRLGNPPPYSPGGKLMPKRHGGSKDVLYLPQENRSRSQSYETEI
ncbi:unnamed protein product, partial [Candidula unifasciata]